MKFKEPRAMEEIHKIREKIWKKTQKLTIDEKFERINKVAERFIKENEIVSGVALTGK